MTSVTSLRVYIYEVQQSGAGSTGLTYMRVNDDAEVQVNVGTNYRGWVDISSQIPTNGVVTSVTYIQRKLTSSPWK